MKFWPKRIRQIWLVTYLYSFAVKSVFKRKLVVFVLFTNISQTECGVRYWTVTLSSYVHKNSDMAPLHCGCTKQRIELLHNAPICLKLWSLALSRLGYTLTFIECRWWTLNQKRTAWHRAVSLRQHGFLVLFCLLRFTKRWHKIMHNIYNAAESLIANLLRYVAGYNATLQLYFFFFFLSSYCCD